MLSKIRDTYEEKYGTNEDKSMLVHMDQRKKKIKKTVEKLIAKVVELMGLKKEEVERAKDLSSALEGSSSIRKSGRIATTPLVAPKSTKTKPLIGEKRKEPTSSLVKEKTSSTKQQKVPKKKKATLKKLKNRTYEEKSKNKSNKREIYGFECRR